MAGPERTEAQVRSQTEHQGPCHAGSCIASRWILHNIQELSRTVIFTFALTLKKKNFCQRIALYLPWVTETLLKLC
jgi:hypothetical protein